MPKMKNDTTERASKLTALIAALFIALIGVFMLVRSEAAPKNGNGQGRGNKTTAVNLYISPSSQRVSVGEEFTLSVWADVGSNSVNAVQANVVFDDKNITYVSGSATESPFGIGAQLEQDGNTVKIARGSYNSLSGTNLIGELTFKATNTARKSQFTFGEGSQIISSDSLINILDTTTKSEITIR